MVHFCYNNNINNNNTNNNNNNNNNNINNDNNYSSSTTKQKFICQPKNAKVKYIHGLIKTAFSTYMDVYNFYIIVVV